MLGFPATYYMFRDVGARPAAELAPTIPCSIYAVFELSFALITPTIVAADIIGGWRFSCGYSILILTIHSASTTRSGECLRSGVIPAGVAPGCVLPRGAHCLESARLLVHQHGRRLRRRRSG